MANGVVVARVGLSAIAGLARSCNDRAPQLATALRGLHRPGLDRPPALDTATIASCVGQWLLEAPDDARSVAEVALATWPDPVDEVWLLGLDDPAHRIAAEIIASVLAGFSPPRPIPQELWVPSLGAADSFQRATEVLVPVIAEASQHRTLASTVFSDLPARLVSTLALLADRLGLDLRQAACAQATGTSDPAALTSRSARNWKYLPHAVRLAELGRWDIVVGARHWRDTSLRAMEVRTSTWVDGDVWQADLLPHIVHHGMNHGCRVDELATDLLRISPFMTALAPAEQAASVAALSAAAWLHDLGQRGGALNDEYVSDYSHVRKFHGLLTREALLKDETVFTELGLASDKPLRVLVAYLSMCHQRNARLDVEAARREPPCGSGCTICPVTTNLLNSTLREEIARQRRNGTGVAVPDAAAVQLAAILRVADAADIGVHRINGRWRVGTRSVEQAWRREYLKARLVSYKAVLKGEAQRIVTQMVVNSHWTVADINALEQGLAKLGLATVATDIRDFDDYLAKQVGYVDQHSFFEGARIVPYGTAFGIELLPSSRWADANGGERQAAVRGACRYIWGEYLHSEQYFDGHAIPPLRAVVDPEGELCQRDRGRGLNA